MIRIAENVAIDSDEYNFVVKERIKKKDKEEYYWKAVAYHRRLEDAVESCYDSMSKAEIKKKDLTLKQAIKELKSMRREIIENTRTDR